MKSQPSPFYFVNIINENTAIRTAQTQFKRSKGPISEKVTETINKMTMVHELTKDYQQLITQS